MRTEIICFKVNFAATLNHSSTVIVASSIRGRLELFEVYGICKSRGCGLFILLIVENEQFFKAKTGKNCVNNRAMN